MSRTDPLPPGFTPPVLSGPEDAPSVGWSEHPEGARGAGLTAGGDPYRLLFESNPNPMWVYDLETLEFLAVNEAAVHNYGYTRDEFLSMTIVDIRPAEDVPAVLDRLERGEDLDRPSAWRHRRKDGAEILVEVRSREIELGGRRCRLVLATDVTERVTAERALRESEERYRELFENASDVIYTHDMDGRYTELNQAAQLLGYQTLDDVENVSAFDLIAPEYHGTARRAVEQMVREGTPMSYELEVMTKDGERVPVEVHSWLLYRDGDPVAVQGIVRDISKRKAAEEALRLSEERYRVISDLISDYAYAVRVEEDGSLVVEWITGSFTRDLGYTAEELNAQGLFSIIHPEDLPEIVQGVQEQQMGMTGRAVTEFRLIARSGEVVWGRFYSTIAVDTSSGITRIYGAGQNITDRVVAEEALRKNQQVLAESERRFRALIENSSEAVMLWGTDATITYVTPSTTRVLGFAEEELVGRNAFESVHRDDAPALRHAFDFALENPGKNVRGVFRVMRKDGTWRWIEGVGKNLLNQPGVEAFVTTFRDVTERVTAEQELKNSLELLQKVDAERRDLMARLVNAQEDERERIALDIHDESIQVMTAVSMRLEVLERRITDPALADACHQLQDSVRRCVASLRELIFEVHPHALEQYGLVPSLRQLLDKAAREIGLEYAFEDGLSGEPPADVRLTVYRLCQESLTNVLKHARARRVDVSLAEENTGIHAFIKDDGVGFFPAEAAQPSAGHLGLAAMRARAETAGGWWKVDSSPGSGTTVEFWVPLNPLKVREA